MRQSPGINGLKQIIFHFHLPSLGHITRIKPPPAEGPIHLTKIPFHGPLRAVSQGESCCMMGACSDGTFTIGEHIVVKVFQFHGDIDGLGQNCGNAIVSNGVIVVLH